MAIKPEGGKLTSKKKEIDTIEIAINNLPKVKNLPCGEYNTIIIISEENNERKTKKFENVFISEVSKKNNKGNEKIIKKIKGKKICGDETKVILAQRKNQKSISYYLRCFQ